MMRDDFESNRSIPTTFDRPRKRFFNRSASFHDAQPLVYVREGNREWCFVQKHLPEDDEYDLQLGRWCIVYYAEDPHRVSEVFEAETYLGYLTNISKSSGKDFEKMLFDAAFDKLDAMNEEKENVG